MPVVGAIQEYPYIMHNNSYILGYTLGACSGKTSLLARQVQEHIAHLHFEGKIPIKVFGVAQDTLTKLEIVLNENISNRT